MFANLIPEQPEITDLIINHEPVSLERLPVRKKDVLAVFSKFQNRKALNAVRAIPEREGFLDPLAVDQLLLTVHWEMQRLAEEFFHGHRVRQLLEPIISALRADGFRGPIRVVDVGSGIGYAIRWLAARTSLAAQGVELVGMDLNSTLVREASRLAAAENLPCRFVQGDAFCRADSAQIYLSTGVVHHFRGEALCDFLRRHNLSETHAFIHYDFHPWLLAPVGSWFFHILRMRTAIARHDGVLSTARAHSGNVLTCAARAALPDFSSGIYSANIWGTPMPRVFQTLIGVRRELLLTFRTQVGHRARRLGAMS